jgi:hypothetical protein
LRHSGHAAEPLREQKQTEAPVIAHHLEALCQKRGETRRGVGSLAKGRWFSEVTRTGLGREEAYMLLSIIGELRVGTSPRPVMATRLIVPEETLRAAGWSGDLP